MDGIGAELSALEHEYAIGFREGDDVHPRNPRTLEAGKRIDMFI